MTGSTLRDLIIVSKFSEMEKTSSEHSQVCCVYILEATSHFHVLSIFIPCIIEGKAYIYEI